VVSKQEVIDAVWDGRIVSDATLNSRMNAARRALGDTGSAQAMIRTVARRGFRFVANVETAGENSSKPSQVSPAAAVAFDGQKPSIVVLPFKNVSGDSGQDYFAAGITEDIITALSRVRWLFVISRNSAFAYPSEPINLTQLQRELSVRYILHGSVRVNDNRVRITSQLVDGEKGNNVWAERFDRELSSIFELQDEITSSIIGSLLPELSLAEIQRARQKRAENLDAWDNYLRALSSMHQLNPQANEDAKNALARAIELDPGFAAAYAGLAWCYVLEAILGWANSGRYATDEALRYARAAVALDENDPRASCALAAVCTWTTYQAEAERAASRAIELDPNMSEAHGMLGYALGFQGKAEQAISALERALLGSPRDQMRWLWYQGIANAHFAAERYAEAALWADKASELRPSWIFGYIVKSSSEALLGRIEEAAVTIRKLLEVYPRYSVGRARRNPMWDGAAISKRFFDGLEKAGAPA
jgi:TolB-like protein/Tfp pilus assembly protein PilF